MVIIKLSRQDVERIIELLEQQPDSAAHYIADGLRESVGWKRQADDSEYQPPQ